MTSLYIIVSTDSSLAVSYVMRLSAYILHQGVHIRVVVIDAAVGVDQHVQVHQVPRLIRVQLTQPHIFAVHKL